jgi:surface protein
MKDIDEEEQIIKDVPVIDKNDLKPKTNPKNKKFLYFGLMIGSILIIITIAIIIALTYGDSSPIPNKEKSNTFKAKYNTLEENTLVKLFSSYIKSSISTMKIDGKNIDLENIDNVYTFRSVGKHSLEIKLAKNLNTMEEMFIECSYLIELDLSDLNTQQVNSTAKMFYKCESLTSINLANMDENLVYNMEYMFYGCTSLTSIDLSHFNTSKVVKMSNLFNGCYKIENINLNNLDATNVEDMNSMFKKYE